MNDKNTRPASACVPLRQLADLTPVHAGAQAQGDLLVLPWPPDVAPWIRDEATATGHAIPAAGIAVAEAVGGHAHELLALGPGPTWTPEPTGAGTTLGTLTVPAGAVAVLGHHEHADLHIGPGVYVVRRQRQATITAPQPEQAGEIDAWTLAGD